MDETPEEMDRLQQLLDRSYETAGAHHRSIATPDRRLDAAGVVAELTGMRVLALATTTAAGEPRVGPVDGHFHHGRFFFGSAHDSFRFRHLRARPAVSASVIEGERLQITVHGTAHEIDPAQEPGLEARLVSVYGREAWESWMREAAWARIEPARMLTYRTG